MKRKHWTIAFIVLLLIDIVSCLFAVWAGGNTLFNQWASIGKPPETAKKIAGLNIGNTIRGIVYRGMETTVYIETVPGNTFQCCENGKMGAWKQVNKIDTNESFYWNLCGQLESSATYHMPDEKDQLGAQWCNEFDYGQISYSIAEDGTVWFRKVYNNPMRTFGWQLLIVVITGLLLYGLFILNNLINVFREWKDE